METKTLAVKLSDSEVLALGQELAEAELALMELHEHQRVTAKQFNESMKGGQERVVRLAASVDSGTEQRAVDCTWESDFDGGVKRLVRTDTGEVIDSADLTPDDLQLEMGGEKPEEPEPTGNDPPKLPATPDGDPWLGSPEEDGKIEWWFHRHAGAEDLISHRINSGHCLECGVPEPKAKRKKRAIEESTKAAPAPTFVPSAGFCKDFESQRGFVRHCVLRDRHQEKHDYCDAHEIEGDDGASTPCPMRGET